MSSIQDALGAIGLEKYSDVFVGAGFSGLDSFLKLSPAELEKAFSDAGMLKGHTFKLKKLIEDAKAGVMPKAPVQAYNFPAARCEGVEAGKQESGGKSVEAASKETAVKAMNVKTQLSSIIESKDTLVKSLKEFVEMDLEVYVESLNQLRTIQQTVIELLNNEDMLE